MTHPTTRPQASTHPMAWALGLVTLAVVLVALLKPANPEPSRQHQDVRLERALQFQDGPQGEVVIIDAHRGETIAALHGEQGFLRQTLRAVARERMRRGLDGQEPVWLQRLDNHHLVLFDPLTHTRIDLMAFGPTNSQVFARWLEPDPQP